MTTIAQYYERVNAAWGHEIIATTYGHKLKFVDPPTPEEAVKGAAKLWRFVTGQSCPFDIVSTTGNRDTWIGTDRTTGKRVLRVNWEHGWYEIVHHLSHYLLNRVAPGTKPHSRDHARLELRMVKQVIKRGWLEGSLKAPAKAPKAAPAVDPRRVKLERILERVARWEAKRKRAETALKKLERSRRYYARVLGEA